MVKNSFLKAIMLTLMLGSVSLAHADPKAGLWKIESVSPKHPNYTSKYEICIEQNRKWYVPLSIKMKPKIRQSFGKNGTWSSEGNNNILLGINQAGTAAMMYVLENVSANIMGGGQLNYSSIMYSYAYSPVVFSVKFIFQGSQCPRLNY